MGVSVPLQRGYMIWEKPLTQFYTSTGGALGDGRDIIRFLFNPSTVNSDYTIGNSQLQAAQLFLAPGDNGNLLAPLSQSVSWSLYFDRTYELAYGTNASAAVNDPATIGVQADVYQFMQFTGILGTLSATQAASVAAGGGLKSNTLTSAGGIMMLIPCYVFFGNALAQVNGTPNSFSYNALANQLAYYGFINEWSVVYTHWTTNMIPIRAVISVNFTMMPSPPVNYQSAIWSDMIALGTAPLPRRKWGGNG